MADGKRESKGSRALLGLMPDHGDQAKIAARLRLSQDQVSRWASGDRKPDAKTRAFLEDELGISWRLWDEPAETQADPSPDPTGAA